MYFSQKQINLRFNMFFKYLFILCLINSCKTNNINNFLTSTIRKDVPPFDMIENWLTKPLLNMEYLDLYIRANNYQKDIANSYTQWFLKQTIVPITISVYDLQKNAIRRKGNGNNVIVTSMTDLRSTLREFAKRAATYFFIVDDDIDFKELRDIFYSYWKQLHIFKNFILTENGVLIYDPFALNETGSYGKVVKYTGKETIERAIFYNMRGYPMKVQIFKSAYSRPIVDPVTKRVKDVYGVDGRVASLLQKHMNFTMNLQYPDPNFFGERSLNGTYNGVIGSITRNELDLCLTGFFIKDYMVPEMDFSVAVYNDQLCIFTPKAQQIPESILPIFAVRYDVWFGFIIMAFFCSFLWAFLRMLNLHFNAVQLHGRRLEKDFRWQYVRILTDTWLVWVRVNITDYPPFHSERVFVVSLCLISVIFGSIFESSLATVYIHPLYYNDIYSLQELDASGLSIMYKYSSMGDDLFFSETSPLFASLNKKLRFVNDINADIIEDVATNGGKAGVTRYTNLMLQSMHLILLKQIWVVPEYPKYYSISYVWPKHAPWDETINQLLLRILNAGLINKYIADMQGQVDIKIMKDHLYETNQGFKILSIEDLQLAFYVMFTGSIMALLSLFIERKQFHIKRT